MGRAAVKKQNWMPLLRWFFAIGLVAAVMALVAAPLQVQAPEAPPPPVLSPTPYGEEDFARENGYLTCLSGESIPGIDVSYHQEDIDWPAVKAAGIEFAFIRVGYRGISEGQIHEDVKARENLAEAAAAGLQVGAYFFSQAITPEEAVEEAELTLQVIRDYSLDLPVVYDWEYVNESARTGAMESQTLQRCIDAFCERITRAGYEPMVYFNPDLCNTLLDLEQVAQYRFWLAMYSDRMNFPYQVEFWQYSDEGTVPGIKGKVDLNLWLP